jgi:hypothetical protein
MATRSLPVTHAPSRRKACGSSIRGRAGEVFAVRHPGQVSGANAIRDPDPRKTLGPGSHRAFREHAKACFARGSPGMTGGSASGPLCSGGFSPPPGKPLRSAFRPPPREAALMAGPSQSVDIVCATSADIVGQVQQHIEHTRDQSEHEIGLRL